MNKQEKQKFMDTYNSMVVTRGKEIECIVKGNRGQIFPICGDGR